MTASLLNESCTKFQCPSCRQLIDLVVYVSPARVDGTTVTCSVTFDEEQFREDFGAHVLAAPETHDQFVVEQI